MKFSDLMADHSVRAVRLKRWASPDDYLELPVIVKGSRTPWCYLVGFNGREMTRSPMLFFQCDDGSDDWLEHKLPDDYTPPKYPSAEDVFRREAAERTGAAHE
jgi:hypothetical protein